MVDLTKDYTFELDGYVFGLGQAVLLTDGGFDPGADSIDAQDTNIAQGDGIQFGRDAVRGSAWTWELGTDQHTPEDALAELGRFKRVWRGTRVRNTPGAVLPLRYRVGGRVRRVYGRPRRFQHPTSNSILVGWIPITCDFTRADDLHYDDVEQSESIGLRASTSVGGLTSPLMEPLSTVFPEGTPSDGQLVVEGDAPTWAKVAITGPVTNPVVELVGSWRVGINGAVAAGETITIDPRPWVRTATTQSGGSAAGRLDRKTRMSRMQVEPGQHVVRFTGSGTSSSARATVLWRSASFAL